MYELIAYLTSVKRKVRPVVPGVDYWKEAYLLLRRRANSVPGAGCRNLKLEGRYAISSLSFCKGAEISESYKVKDSTKLPKGLNRPPRT